MKSQIMPQQHFEDLCINTVSHTAYFPVNRRLIQAIGFLEAGMMAFLVKQYEYYRNHEKLQEDHSFYVYNQAFRDELNITDYRRREILSVLEHVGLIRSMMKGFPQKKYYQIQFHMLHTFLFDNSHSVDRQQLAKTRHSVEGQQNEDRDHSVDGRQNDKKSENSLKDHNLSKVDRMTPFCRRSTGHSVEGQQNDYNNVYTNYKITNHKKDRDRNIVPSTTTATDRARDQKDVVAVVDEEKHSHSLQEQQSESPSSAHSYTTLRTAPYEIPGTPEYDKLHELFDTYALPIASTEHFLAQHHTTPFELEKAIQANVSKLTKRTASALFGYIHYQFDRKGNFVGGTETVLRGVPQQDNGNGNGIRAASYGIPLTPDGQPDTARRNRYNNYAFNQYYLDQALRQEEQQAHDTD